MLSDILGGSESGGYFDGEEIDLSSCRRRDCSRLTVSSGTPENDESRPCRPVVVALAEAAAAPDMACAGLCVLAGDVTAAGEVAPAVVPG